MSIKKINQTNNPKELKILRSPAIPVKDVTTVKGLIQDLVDTAESLPNCAGLAANQIWDGKADQIPSVCIVRWDEVEGDPENKDKWKPIINPTGKGSGPNKKDLEACLSSSHQKPKIKRRKKNYSLVYYDTSGLPHPIKATGPFARVLQHEVDHLRGITLWKE